MMNTEDVVFFGAARCEKGLCGKVCPFVLVCASVVSSDGSISRICVANKNRGGCVHKLTGNV